MTDRETGHTGSPPGDYHFQQVLLSWKLLVSGDRIDLVRVTPNIEVPVDQLIAFAEAWSAVKEDLCPGDDWMKFASEADLISGYAGVPFLSGITGFGSGNLHKSLHKGLHKSLHKGLHKSLRIRASSDGGGLSWPEIEVPWREIDRLYDLRSRTHDDSSRWDRHWFPAGEDPPPEVVAPPSIDQLAREIAVLHKMQEILRQPESAWRRERIVLEATNDLTAYMLPLGADAGTSAGNTAVMFQVILWLGSMIGQQYKARYNQPRPSVVDPTLEPYIPVPVYSSWPSNHAFQSFLIAEVFSRMVPEHGGSAALFHSAWGVAVNREFAGLHYRSDTLAGMKLARLVAPAIEEVLEDHRRGVRAEWLGESEEGGE